MQGMMILEDKMNVRNECMNVYAEKRRSKKTRRWGRKLVVDEECQRDRFSPQPVAQSAITARSARIRTHAAPARAPSDRTFMLRTIRMIVKLLL